ncbi:MAG: A/G-specific adenine glycosylase [Sandaracinus sp.]
MKPAARERAKAELTAWFRESARDLPWRRTSDPYAIWVSEVMLQQTRVETVLRYYAPFLARFPTPDVLAAASEDDVLARWSGLGYYRRARLLHEGAKAVVARHGGRVPEDADARRALPGVGRYTAGAIGSIAFGRREPIVDGNVARVLSRLDAIEAPLGSRESEAALWAEASAWAEHDAPGVVNQALMELGATLCTPSAPRCGDCPVRRDCRARKAGSAESLPVPRAKKAPREVGVVALVIRDPKGRVLLVKHAPEPREEGDPARGLFAGDLFRGLWAVPMAEGEGRGVARALADACGASLRAGEPEELVHVLTHRRLSVRVFEARLGGAPRGGVLVDPRALDDLGVATLTRKVIASRDRYT